MNNRTELDEVISSWGLEQLPYNNDVLFRAGKAFKKYREINHGPKLGVLPDFLIGAMAEVHGYPLMTANSKDFIGYFDNVTIIKPNV